MTRARPRRRRHCYRRPHSDNWFTSITVGDIKNWLYVMVPIVTAVWLFAGPYVDAQAESLLKDKLIQIGMDPATVQSLNKNILSLEQNVQELSKSRDDTNEKLDEAKKSTEELSDDVKALKGELAPLIELLKIQALKGSPPLNEPAK